jgi:hypothetical protein
MTKFVLLVAMLGVLIGLIIGNYPIVYTGLLLTIIFKLDQLHETLSNMAVEVVEEGEE